MKSDLSLCALAVDFGGTSIKMGVTQGDQILATAKPIPTQSFNSPQEIIAAMIETAKELQEKYPNICVMGMGMPGWCNYYEGVLYQLTNVPVWDHVVPVKEMMEKALGIPVVLDNDANCMAYAEWKFGAGKGLSNVVCMTMGTGLGGGIVLRDRVLRGKRISAAEIGMTSIYYAGKPGPFGNKGGIEEYIGNNEMAHEYYERCLQAGKTISKEECTPKHIEDQAKAGCEIALSVWKDTAEKLACLIMNLMYTFVPESFIIGGGVAKAGDLLMQPLLASLKQQLFHLHWEDLNIQFARFGSEAGLIGAGAMALDEYLGLGELNWNF